MSQPSPPKPWERPGAPVEPAPPVPTTVPTATTTSDSPLVPSRPSTIGSSTILPTTSPYSTMNPLNSSYSSPYSSFGSYSSPYSSYNRFGSYGSPYSSYGGYGSTYGGYGMGGYGYGMGMNSMNPMMDPNNPSLIQQVESSTQQTFQLLQSIVQTFGGFAQMLDSTFMATHSSFFAMLGVAEQFGHMRQALGQVAGVFGLVGWLRGWWRGDKANMASDFKRFLADGGANVPGGQPGQPGRPRPSKKPLVIFLIAVFGLPYLMHKLVKRIMARLPPPGTTGPQGLPLNIDPSKLTFARAVFPFPSKDPVELSLAKGDIVAVLSTADPATGAESEWWRGRTRDGREGWFPRAFVETIKPKEVSDAAQAPPLAPPKVVD